MRFLLFLAVLCQSSSPALVGAPPFVPEQYQSQDGALLIEANGDYVEPYFATKALIVAQDTGLDVHEAASDWITWALAHQKKDGRFERYCRKQNEEWRPCGAADADDSMLALWLQLLYRMAPDSGLPAAWQLSAQNAQTQLSRLRNGRLGVYRVSSRNHVPLFMDNVEVYSALQDIARAKSRFGDADGARETAKQADKLASAIQHVFWSKHSHWYRSSMQNHQPGFYPDVVAQVYPWLAGLNGPGQEISVAWKDWKNRFGQEWLNSTYDPHPWGLVALAALKTGDNGVVMCWLARSESLRYSESWNILEEAIFQALDSKFARQRLADAGVCSHVLSR